MGQVYKAEHRRMERIVALKILPPATTRSKENLLRFQREVKAVAKLSHPNIVTAYDADEAKGFHFLVMECVEGPTGGLDQAKRPDADRTRGQLRPPSCPRHGVCPRPRGCPSRHQAVERPAGQTRGGQRLIWAWPDSRRRWGPTTN